MYIAMDPKKQVKDVRMKVVRQKPDSVVPHEQGHASDVSDVEPTPKAQPFFFKLSLNMDNLQEILTNITERLGVNSGQIRNLETNL